MTREPSKSRGKAPRFGGDWTEAKLGVIAKYLRSYTTALKEQPSKERPLQKAYIDAFAGTGYREARRDDEGPQTTDLLLPDLAEREPQALLDGSARLALRTEPRFDKYIFIERSAGRCAHLESLKSEFPALAKRSPGHRRRIRARVIGSASLPCLMAVGDFCGRRLPTQHRPAGAPAGRCVLVRNKICEICVICG